MNKNFWKAAGIRALKTFCQVAGSMLVIGAFNETAWSLMIQTAAISALGSVLTSVATGLPEVEE